ncbi:helix-turn-helix domain-containing protein [Anaerococcus sp. Marseille-P3625]|uniref:helix-turn-helix domain-containing protein n=1 Tax=Anaerococcus sp. Marseille-P3625 TaxID=1977277 RepID=UPI000C068410|nr:helix-turn-helix transcriptional regulator [Anaerococcus sp. Marseille-P3625]
MNTTYSRIRDLRLKNKKTQKEIGEILGTSANMYQKYEYGQVELPVRHAKKLGKYFKFNWWELYED